MISILLVEDHALLAEALSRLLQEAGLHHVVAIAPSAESAQERLPDIDVDLVLVDVSLPKMSGIDLVAKLHEHYPNLPCLMLSGHNASQYVKRSLAAGARGYLLKEDVTGILEGIDQVLRGNVYISKSLREAQ